MQTAISQINCYFFFVPFFTDFFLTLFLATFVFFVILPAAFFFAGVVFFFLADFLAVFFTAFFVAFFCALVLTAVLTAVFFARLDVRISLSLSPAVTDARVTASSPGSPVVRNTGPVVGVLMGLGTRISVSVIPGLGTNAITFTTTDAGLLGCPRSLTTVRLNVCLPTGSPPSTSTNGVVVFTLGVLLKSTIAYLPMFTNHRLGNQFPLITGNCSADIRRQFTVKNESATKG